jgi:hypothetical protein
MDTMFNPAWLVCLDSTHSCDVTVRVLVLLDIRTYRGRQTKSLPEFGNVLAPIFVREECGCKYGAVTVPRLFSVKDQ